MVFNTKYWLVFEDGLEMVGVLTMILASISWLKKQGVTELVLNKKLTYFVCLVGFLDLFVSYLIQIVLYHF